MIYLDHHATTPCDPRVVEAMLPFFSKEFANPSSRSHEPGRSLAERVMVMRQEAASALRCQPEELVFTSGATEANNLAISGVLERERQGELHVVAAATEHASVHEVFEAWRRRGVKVTLLPVDSSGRMDPEDLPRAVTKSTRLVAVMAVNNEVGTIQPLPEVSAFCRTRGVPLHVDFAQMLGALDINLEQLGADTASFSAHKVYGPKGIGALYVRRSRPRLRPLISGGGQEGGLRSGTLNVPGIAGFSKALSIWRAEKAEIHAAMRARRDLLAELLLSGLEGCHVHGPALDKPGLRHPGNLCVGFEGLRPQALWLGLTEIAVSTGSACNSTHPEPSRVLRAMGVKEEICLSTLRFGVGRHTSEDQIREAAGILIRHVQNLRQGQRLTKPRT